MEKQQKIRRMKKKTQTCEFIFTPTKNSVEKFGHNFIKLRINWFARYNFFLLDKYEEETSLRVY